MKIPNLQKSYWKQLMLLLCLGFCFQANAQEHDVTFNVDMQCAGVAFSNVYVTGPWAGWCGDCYMLEDSDGDNVYTGTFSLPEGDQEYKYEVDNWASQEDLVDDMVNGASCAPVTDFFEYANRVVSVSSEPAVINDTYGSCEACPSTGEPDCEGVIDGGAQPGTACDDGDPATSNDVYSEECECMGSVISMVNFSVNMNCADLSFGTVYVTGPWASWCGDCYPLADDDEDGIWTASYEFSDGTFEYKYEVDNWASQEDLVDDMVDGGDCAPVTDFFEYANRTVEVAGGDVDTNDSYGSCTECEIGLQTDCLGEAGGSALPGTACDDGDETTTDDVYGEDCVCAGTASSTDVTFNVDMSCAGVEFGIVYVTGPFAEWCGDCYPLADEDGDGVWSTTIAFTGGTIEYKYEVDNWASQEDLVDDMVAGGSCAPVTDFFEYANRTVDVAEGASTNDTYGSCTACPDPEADCEGVLGGSALPGTACDDGDATTSDDVYGDDCVCAGVANSVEITLNVDMACAGVEFGIVYVTGPFADWCGDCYPLSDEDGDGVWTTTLTVNEGTTLEYKYEVDNWASQEDLVDDMVAGGSCAPITDFFEFANRSLEATEGATSNDTYGSCDACPDLETDCEGVEGGSALPGTACDDGDETTSGDTYNNDCACVGLAATYPVNFSVDMNNAELEFGIVYVTGPWTDWCGNCFPLSDEDGDGIWTATYEFAAGEYEYIYEVDDWASQEDLIDDMQNGASCAPVTDFSTYANRVVTVGTSGATLMDSYGCCENCSSIVGCAAEAGSFDADGSGTQCQNAAQISASVSGNNADFASAYVLTLDDAGFTIVDINTSGSFSGMAVGAYRVHLLNLDPAEAPADLGALIGASAVEVLGTLNCFDLETAAAASYVVAGVEVDFDYVCDGETGDQTFTVSATGGLPQLLAEDGNDDTNAAYSITGVAATSLEYGDAVTFVQPQGVPLTMEVSGGGNCSASISSNINCTTLEVELINFDARYQGAEVVLNWTTAMESNSASFEVYYSNNGIDFDYLTSVNAQGFSDRETNYTSTHSNPSPNTTYYQLKMIDLDNNSRWSDIVQVSKAGNNTASVYPGIVNVFADIILTSEQLSEATINVFDVNGRLVYTQETTVEGLEQIQLNTSNWNQGMYVVDIKIGDQQITEKLIKQ